MAVNKFEQFIFFKRLFIIFGSICFLWLVIGFIFLSIQTYRHCKKKAYKNFSHYNHSLQPPASSPLIPITEHTLIEPKISNCDHTATTDDDRISICTFISERTKNIHEHANFISSSQKISEQQHESTFQNTPETSNLFCHQSTVRSLVYRQSSLLNYPEYRNLAYYKSNVSLSSHNVPSKGSPHLLASPVNNSLSPNFQFHSKCQSSTYPNLNTITTMKQLPSRLSVKTLPLPTVMITDVDRLQTDIIELEYFEPDKEWSHRNPQLRRLLNDHMPQDVK